MEKLVAVYNVYVYDSGKIEFKQLSHSGNIDTQGASSSIRQIVKVLEHVANNESKSGIRKKVSQAINAVAEEEGISIASVHAKVTRKLGLPMAEFKDSVEGYFSGNDMSLENTLREACVARTKAADNAAVEQLLAKIRSKKEK